MAAQKSRLLFYSSLCSLICGLVIIGLAAWNASEVEWSPLTNAIAAVGGVMIATSLMGMMNSQGWTFCCHVGLYLYLWVNGALSLAGIGFVIAAWIKKSEWIEEMAKKYSDDESEENIDHLKKKYDEFMPFVIAFGIITVFSCVVGFLSGWRYLSNLNRVVKVERNIVTDRAERRAQAEREKVKRLHHETIVQMTEKYRKNRDSDDGKLLP